MWSGMGRGPLLVLAPYEIEVTAVDEESRGLAEDENRIQAINSIGQEGETPADREEPERDRDHASSGALAGNPLHQETRGEQQLRDQAERQPEIEFGHEDVVEIVAERLPELLVGQAGELAQACKDVITWAGGTGVRVPG